MFDLKHHKEELRYKAKHAGQSTAGSLLTAGVRALSGGGMTEVALKTSKAFAKTGKAATSYFWGVFTMALSFGVKVYLHDQEFLRERERIRDHYAKEVGSLLGKDPKEVTVEDLEEVAETNPTLHKAINHGRFSRNVKNVIAGLGMVTAFAVVMFAVPALIPALGQGIALTMAGAGIGMTAMGIGQSIYRGVLNKVLNVKKPTVADTIEELHYQSRIKGKSLSPEQVLGVYVQNNPNMDNLIKASFGKSYDKLDEVEQRRAMMELNMKDEIDSVTIAINEHDMNPRELTFRIHGQSSGASADPDIKTYVKQKTTAMVRDINSQRKQATQNLYDFKDNFMNNIYGKGKEEQGYSYTKMISQDGRGGRKPSEVEWTVHVNDGKRGREAVRA